MFLQRGSRLLCLTQHRAVGYGISAPNKTHGQGTCLLDHCPTGQACVVYRCRLGVAVAADGDQPRPTCSGKDLLRSWLAGFRFLAIVTAFGCVLAIVWIVVSS